MVFDVYWVGDARAHDMWSGTQRLLMRWHAVASPLRGQIEEELTRLWLPKASAWAAAAPRRGNVWSATDHRWMVVLNGTTLGLVEDGPGLA
jgi:hypothetical protein